METLKAGEMFEGFRIMSELGRGAASIIYLAQEVKTKQVWALKHVAKETAKDQRFLDQAEQEYQIASNLNHPRIRKIDRLIKKKTTLLSVTDLWLVMEVVDGASLENEPPATFEEAASVFEQVADGLAHMHSRGYAHADMKPNNIIVNDEAKCKVIDLGQSCRIGTVKERIQGTPDYIAPEQVHRRAITERTDIYNLGATMYRVMTRHFVPTALSKGDSLLGSRDDNLMERPARAIDLNKRIPTLMDQLIMECIEVDPAHRPRTMEEVKDRLNFIKAKLLAEQDLRKSGMLPRFDDPARAASSGAPARTNGEAKAAEAAAGAEAGGVGSLDPFDPDLGPLSGGQDSK